MPTRTGSSPICGSCHEQKSRYKCPSCPVRYCSVGCYKSHKATTCPVRVSPRGRSRSPLPVHAPSTLGDPIPAPTLDIPDPTNTPRASSLIKERQIKSSIPLRPLTEIDWPPEPDPAIFSDPMLREDPKPLRREELMRIATSRDLRHLLSTPTLPRILRILDSLPSPRVRSNTLSRLLSIDYNSLSKPGGGTFLTDRSSPPPLSELIKSLTGDVKDEDPRRQSDEKGWWLGKEGGGDRVWIGEEERRLMRVWAGLVCRAIDGAGGEEWGEGGLGWEI